MNSSDRPAENAAGARGGDRRQGDRRREDRRAPLPWWRRPWAYVTYGIAGAIVGVLILSRGDDAEPTQTPTSVGTTSGQPAVDSGLARGAGTPVEDAYGTAGFESLLAAGGNAAGKRVRTTLYCEPIRSVALRRGGDVRVSASVAAAADSAGRVPAAECRWGGDPSAPELLVVVPAELVPTFASAPEVEQSFVRRREVAAEVEWIGRSDALSLRIVAVLHEIGTSER